MSDFSDDVRLFPGGEIRGRDSTASRSSTRSTGSKRRRSEFEEVIPSIEEHDTPPPLGSAENPFSISSNSDDSESSDDNENNGGASSPKRRRIHSNGVGPPECSPITPLRQTIRNSTSDSQRWVRGPTSESGVEDQEELRQWLQVDDLDPNGNGDHGEKSDEDTVPIKYEVEYWEREEESGYINSHGF
jgi:hypothetical protein